LDALALQVSAGHGINQIDERTIQKVKLAGKQIDKMK
jgi:hypothetical protein